MKDVKKVLLKLVLLAVLLVGMDQVYRHFFFVADLNEFSPVMEQVEAVKDSARVVYISESSNFTFRDEDADKRSISQYTGDYFPEIPFGTIQNAASHAGVYQTLLQHLRGEEDIETVIVTMNLRSFNANWVYSKLETALQKSMVLASQGPPLWKRFRLSFRDYEIKTEQERREQFKAAWAAQNLQYPADTVHKNVFNWERRVRKNGVRNPDGSRNETWTKLAIAYVKTYAFQIDTLNNPRIANFDRIAQEENWNLIFLIVPENITRAGELVPNLPWLMRQNRDLLVERYTRQGAQVLDLMELLPNAAFIDQNWTTEHYIESGRKEVASKLAETLRTRYPDAYEQVVYNSQAQHEFFNDCEGNTIWVQMGSLSDDRAYSGKQSTRVGKEKPFSISFTRATTDLDTAYMDSVEVSFWLYQEQLDHLGSISIEAGGDATGSFWDSTALQRYTQVVDQWVKVEARLPLWPEFPRTEVMKIYLYNPSPYWIWVDDIRIRFLGEPEKIPQN